MLSEALGRLDVNTVCPLPGSWINHVHDFPFVLVPWKALGRFGRLWRVLLALQSFVRLWEALSGGLERLRKVLGGFVT